MTHTPEPWMGNLIVYRGGHHAIVCLGNQHVQLNDDKTWEWKGKCQDWSPFCPVERTVNGCAGLNPAAYRECVEAARAYLNHPHDNEGINIVAAERLRQALAHATDGRST